MIDTSRPASLRCSGCPQPALPHIVLSKAVGGATTAIVTLARQLLLRPPPPRNPGRVTSDAPGRTDSNLA